MAVTKSLVFMLVMLGTSLLFIGFRHIDKISHKKIFKELSSVIAQPHNLNGTSGYTTTPKIPKDVAIIVPYRDRKIQLKIFLRYMESFLFKQGNNIRIYIIEQTKGKFNRAKLFNIGYKESLKDGDYKCFIFHDVDLLPEEAQNRYSCERKPVHMSAAVDKFKYRLLYPGLFGGVVSLAKDHMESANGFSNVYWGWGGEDDDMYKRLNARGLTPMRRSMAVSRYTMLRFVGNHTSARANPKRMKYLNTALQRQKTDGLSSLDYTVINKKAYDSHTWILADLHPPPAEL